MTALDDDLYTEDEAKPARASPRRGGGVRYNPTHVRGEAAFRSAARHSTLVNRLKYILPGLAIAGIALFWRTARFIPGDLESLVKSSGIDVKTNTVVMQKPQISGFAGTRRAYEIKADSAVQSLSDPKIVTFTKIAGNLGLEDSGTATLSAPSGVYDGNTNTLTLKDGIDIETTTGYAAHLSGAAIDLGGGSMTSSEPLELRAKEGTLRANAIEVLDRGKRVVFRNGVSVTYLPPGELVSATGDTSSQTAVTP